VKALQDQQLSAPGIEVVRMRVRDGADHCLGFAGAAELGKNLSEMYPGTRPVVFRQWWRGLFDQLLNQHARSFEVAVVLLERS